jgi:hypothetical protein
MSDNQQDSHAFRRAITTVGAVVFTGVGAAIVGVGLYSLVTGKATDWNLIGGMVKEEHTRAAGAVNMMFGGSVLQASVDKLMSEPWRSSTEQKPSGFVRKVTSEPQASESQQLR